MREFHQPMSQMPPAAAVIAHPSQNNPLGCERMPPTPLSPEDGVAAETRRGALISIAIRRYGLAGISEFAKVQRECVRLRMCPYTCINNALLASDWRETQSS